MRSPEPTWRCQIRDRHPSAGWHPSKPPYRRKRAPNQKLGCVPVDVSPGRDTKRHNGAASSMREPAKPIELFCFCDDQDLRGAVETVRTRISATAPAPRPCAPQPAGGVAEWFMALVLKTSVLARVPGVRIPPPPPPFVGAGDSPFPQGDSQVVASGRVEPAASARGQRLNYKPRHAGVDRHPRQA